MTKRIARKKRTRAEDNTQGIRSNVIASKKKIWSKSRIKSRAKSRLAGLLSDYLLELQ